jgi:hypothetical protein
MSNNNKPNQNNQSSELFHCMINEGYIKKGGQNSKPATVKPAFTPPPQKPKDK